MPKVLTSALFKRARPVLAVAAGALVLYGGYRVDRTMTFLEQANDPAGRELIRVDLAYSKKMSELEPADILSPEALAADPGMVRTRAKLAERVAVMERHRAWVAKTPAVEQAEVLRMLDLELAMAREFDAIVDLLDAAEGRWRVHQGQVVFSSPRDEAALAVRWRTLERLMAEQDVVRAQALAKGAYSAEEFGG